MVVYNKRSLPNYMKDQAAKDGGVEVKKFINTTSNVEIADCTLCHGSGKSVLYRCQAIQKNTYQCGHEAINHIHGSDDRDYFLCGRHTHTFMSQYEKEVPNE